MHPSVSTILFLPLPLCASREGGRAERFWAQPEALDVFEGLPVGVALIVVGRRRWRRVCGGTARAAGLPGLAVVDPLANGGVYGGMHDGLVEIDDQREFTRAKQMVGGLALDALGLLERDGGAERGVGHLDGRA